MRNEQPIERIAVMTFECCAAHDLAKTDFQLLESVQRHLVRKEAVDNPGQAKLVEVNFNRDFPKARIADEAILLRYYFASFLREFGAVLTPPEKRVGVESSSRCRSFTVAVRKLVGFTEP